MKNSSWKKIIGVTLSIFALFFGSIGLTSCDLGGEGGEGEELEQEGEELEQEEEEDDDEDDDDEDDDDD